VRANAVPTLASIAARHIESSELARDLRRLQASTWIQAQFIVALGEAGKSVARRWIERVARRLAAVRADHPIFATDRRPDWGVRFCEAAAAEVPRRIALALIARLGAPLPGFAPSDSGEGPSRVRRHHRGGATREPAEDRKMEADIVVDALGSIHSVGKEICG
jgi:hypothetical protein